MTAMLLPLVVSLASVSINTASFTPVDDLPSGKPGSGYLSGEDGVDGAAVASAVSSVIAGSSYPQAYRWTSGGGSTELGNSAAPISQAGDVSGANVVVEAFADPDDYADDEFSWTTGVGIVGIGFRWRFR